MKLPNVLSTAVILAIAALLEYIAAGADSVFPSIWVPVAVLLLMGVAKALQVYAQSRGDAPDTVVMDAAERKAANPVRRVLLD